MPGWSRCDLYWAFTESEGLKTMFAKTLIDDLEREGVSTWGLVGLEEMLGKLDS